MKHVLNRGVFILARNDIIYQAINLNKLCKEKVFEVSAVTIHTCSTKVILCCVYRSPAENPNYFLQHLEKNTETYIPAVSLVICGDLYTSCLPGNMRRLTHKLSRRNFSEAKPRLNNENL